MALIPPGFMDCVVSIGTEDAQGNRRWVATGFLYGRLEEVLEDGQKFYRVYLITNRHVFEGLTKAYLRFNPQADEPARDYEIESLNSEGGNEWTAHPDPEIDVAIMPIMIKKLREHAMKVSIFQNDVHSVTVGEMRDLGVTEGDFAYVLGFPMGLVGERRNTVIVRSGTIARIQDVMRKANDEFLVDVFVFPGNSGGPVISKPEAVTIHGTKASLSARLIGIVKAYVPYQDVALSAQTGRPRVIFEENSGLAAVHPVDYIEETIDAYEKAAAAEAQAKENRQG
ncbi:MAG TPA: serine protease [Symbiobacteriaceae bacterium]|nr:serine protease [Symbiobacteriaceae bacterium]